MQVSELMTPSPVVIKAEDTVLTAAEALAHMNVRALPVVRNGRLVGLITDFDIAARVVTPGLDPETTRIEAVVSGEQGYCYADDEVDEAVERMNQLRVLRLAVVNRTRRVVGMISIEDIETCRSAALERPKRRMRG